MDEKNITITLPDKVVRKIVEEYVLVHYGDILGAKNLEDLKWNDCTLMTGGDGVRFTSK